MANDNESTFKAYGFETVQTDNGGESQNMFGCDGDNHAVSKDVFTVVGDEYPSDYETETIGLCDGTCVDGLANPHNHGSGFLHTVVKSELVSS